MLCLPFCPAWQLGRSERPLPGSGQGDTCPLEDLAVSGSRLTKEYRGPPGTKTNLANVGDILSPPKLKPVGQVPSHPPNSIEVNFCSLEWTDGQAHLLHTDPKGRGWQRRRKTSLDHNSDHRLRNWTVGVRSRDVLVNVLTTGFLEQGEGNPNLWHLLITTIS